MPSSLSPADIGRLDQLIRHNRKVRRGEHLFRAPDALKSLYAIRSGFFKTYVLHEDGREQVTGFSMTGEILGMDAISLEALETLVRVAGMAVELLAVARAAPAERPAARIEPTPQRAPVTVTPEPDEEVTQTAPHLPEFDVTATHPGVDAVQPVAAIQPAVEVQPSEPAPQFANPLGTARRYTGSADADLPVEVSEEERPQHVGARRFAKLLVSEIKLYNESKVAEGRDHGDLYERLRDTIDRSREMYNKRYSATVGSQFDYFHHELVNTLAEGNESKLGDGYPGASA